MAIVSKPNYAVGIWASNGDIAAQTSEKIEQGHIVEIPLKETMNWIQNRQDVGIVYGFQQGIPEWDFQTEYPTNAYTKRSGNIYKALSANIDKDPTTNTSIWRLAFDTYGSSAAVQAQVDLIKTQEGYLDLYVSKANPAMTGKCLGVSYSAAVGIPVESTDIYGYTFTGYNNKGLFLDSSGTPIITDGSNNFKFKNVLDDDSVVRLKDLKEYLEFYKVGDLYLTTDSANPSSRLGYGIWERYAEGQAIVGVSNDNTKPLWTRFGGSEFGEYSHVLTIPEMPRHRFPINAVVSDSGGTARPSFDTVSNAAGDVFTDYLGNDTAHNNVQPSITVYIWRRTS